MEASVKLIKRPNYFAIKKNLLLNFAHLRKMAIQINSLVNLLLEYLKNLIFIKMNPKKVNLDNCFPKVNKYNLKWQFGRMLCTVINI